MYTAAKGRDRHDTSNGVWRAVDLVHEVVGLWASRDVREELDVGEMLGRLLVGEKVVESALRQ